MFNMCHRLFTECNLDGKYLLFRGLYCDWWSTYNGTISSQAGRWLYPCVCLIRCLRVNTLSVKREIKLSEQATPAVKGN